MQMAFYFDQTRCTGCSICAIVCKDWNGVPVGPANWLTVKRVKEGRFPRVIASAMIRPCYHCAMPPCVDGCPVGAIIKRESDGLVIVDRAACLGHDRCNACSQICPYDAPQFSAGRVAKMEKCDFCAVRLAQGKAPFCVAACPARALECGPLEELSATYGPGKEAEGFTYDARVAPSIILRARKKMALGPSI